ncbi:MAG TPA: tetratricopeptide repeat protein [Anaerolineaceae bacterium]|nr:tetratricopeptide repeat protein [Anaerolineaceae bacterium]
MQYIDLITRLNNLANKDEVAANFKALRQDALVWEGLQTINEQSPEVKSLISQKMPLNPGTLAFLMYDPGFDFSELNNRITSREVLEKLMFGYENYVQTKEPVSSLAQAGMLALALIEKRKASPNWVNILQDFVTRMKIIAGEEVRRYWGTILVIVVNLIEEKEAFFKDISVLHPPELSIEVINHLVLCLPWSDEEKAETLRRYLYPLDAQTQVDALKILRKMAGSDLPANIAGRILEKYYPSENGKRKTKDSWKNPVASMHFALQCQAAADIAQIAGQNEVAAELNDESFNVLSALVKMNKVKKAGIVFDSKTSETTLDTIFSDDELTDPEILSELAYTTASLDLPLPDESSATKIILQAKKMAKAGNTDLAREELRTNLKRLSDDEFKQVLANGPEYVQGWDPVSLLNTLVESGAHEEADRLGKVLLAQNPTSIAVHKAAAAADEGKGDYHAALEHLEVLDALEPGSKEVMRKLADMNIKTGADNSAYEIYRRIIDQADLAEEKDLIRFGEIALQIEKPDEALTAAGEVLGRNPESSRGLTLAGMAHRRKGLDEAAVEELRRAITIAEGDPTPWIELAEIAWAGGDHPSTLTTLKEGIAANPGNSLLQSVYAHKLMDEGLISEAFPYLLELSVKGSEPDIDLLLIGAMKHLGMENIEETLERFIDRYPGNHHFIAEYGVRLIWKGEIQKGLDYLKSIIGNLADDPAWSLAYVEGMMQPDYHLLFPPEKISKSDLSFTRGLLEGVLISEPDNLRAKLLKAEWLLHTEDYVAARKLFDAIMDESQGGRDLPSARLYAGLAQTAARTEEHEVAMAALEQAISIQPDWYGLQRIKAEFLRLAGDLDAAVKQGMLALDQAPEAAENHVWFIEFLTGMGKTGNLEKQVNDAIETHPEHLGLRLIQAQNRIGLGSDDENQEIERKLLKLIDKTEDPGELIKAAVVFSALENTEKTIVCLEKAVSTGSLQAHLSLAGLYRMAKEHDKAIAVLSAVHPLTGMINLLLAETAFDQSGTLEESRIQSEEKFELADGVIAEQFMPAAWRELIDSSRPDIALRTRMVLIAGEPPELMDEICNWVNNEPENLEARLYAIEIALGCQAMDDYQRFLDFDASESRDNLLNHFLLLKSEYQLDTDTLVRDDPMAADLFETVSVGQPQKISLIRMLAADGNLYEAETSLDMAISVFSEGVDLPYVVRIGILRNLAKSAAVLNRWPEAIQLSERAFSSAPKHASIQVMRIKHLALAMEMKNRAETLGVERHSVTNDSLLISIDPDVKVQNTDNQSQGEAQHWILRCTLAKEPNREGIRALALLTPAGEDAAALMAGLRRIGQHKTALQVAKKFDEHPLVMFEQALCTSENDVQKAIALLEKSLLVQPVQPLALRLRAEYLERAGKLAEAAESLTEAIDLWPNESRWHIKAAELWQSLGNIEKPVEHLRLADLYSQNTPVIQEKLGKALLRNAKPDEALKYLLAAVEKQPESQDLWQSISEAHQQAGDLNLAMEAAERAVQVDPFAVKARLQASKVRWTRGELEKALDQVNLAISLDPEDAENYVFMAKLLLEQGDKAKALNMLEKASQSKNADVRAMVEHASLLKDIKGAAAARDLIAMFSEQYPENPELLRLLAEAEDQCGNLKKAEMVAKKALDIHPDETDLQMLLGKIQEKVGNLDQAVNYFSQAIALEPKRKDGYLNLSQVYLKQRDHSKARKVLEQGIEKLPGEISLYLTCASLLKEAKDYQAAEQMLRKASSLDPRNVNVHRQLGAVLALNLVHQSQEVSSQP